MTRNWSVLTDRLRVSIAPGFKHGGEGFAWNADGIDNHIVHRDLFQVHCGENAIDIASEEKIGSGSGSECRRRDVPKLARIMGTSLEVKHPVILGDYVQVASLAGDAGQLGKYAIGIRNGMKNVTANREIEAAIWDAKLEEALVLETQAL